MKQFFDPFDFIIRMSVGEREKAWTGQNKKHKFFSLTNIYRIKSQLGMAERRPIWIIDEVPNFLNKIFLLFLCVMPFDIP